MTYGYHANLWVNSTVGGLDEPVNDLIHSLKIEREVREIPTNIASTVLMLLGARTLTGL